MNLRNFVRLANKQTLRAFSLLEVMIAMFVLGLMALALTKGLTHAKYTAEGNLFEGTALTAAVSTIEQMKGASLNLLQDPPLVDGKKVFKMIIADGLTQNLVLNEVNTVTVPVVTDEGGSIGKTLDLNLTPRIESMTTFSGYWLSVEYSYTRPGMRRIHTSTVRNAQSLISF